MTIPRLRAPQKLWGWGALAASVVMTVSVFFGWFRYPGDEFGAACTVPGIRFGVGIAALIAGVGLAVSTLLVPTTRLVMALWVAGGCGGVAVALLVGPTLLDKRSIDGACGSAFRYALEYGGQGTMVLLIGGAALIVAAVAGWFGAGDGTRAS